MSQLKTYAVDGMTCEHCRLSVTEEILAVSGVASIDVDLAAGRVTVRGDRLDDEAIAAAVDEAGYRVAS
jgi:copper chaperone CopZ